MGLTLGNAPKGSAFLILCDEENFVMWVKDKNGIYFDENENELDADDFEDFLGEGVDFNNKQIKVVTDQLEKKKLSEIIEYTSFLYDGFYYYKPTSSSGSQTVIKPHSPKCMDKSVIYDCQVLVVPDDYTNFEWDEDEIDSTFDTNDFFRKVDRCVYDFRSGLLGVKRSDEKGFSIFTKGSGKTKPKVDVCELKAFGHGIPAFAIRTPIKDLTPGDVVIVKDQDGTENWLYYLSTETDGDTSNIEISGIETDGGKKVSIAVQDGMLLMGDALLCVKNFFGDKNSMNNMMLPLLLMNKKSGEDNSALIAMMMMGGSSDPADPLQKMLPLMLMGGGKMDSKMMMVMMMMQNKSSDMNSMLPLMLMGDSDINPMVLMMMMNGGKMPGCTAAPAA